MSDELKKYPIMKTVSARDVEDATRYGWRVVQVIPCVLAHDVLEDNKEPRPPLNNYNPNYKEKLSRSVMETTVMFLMGRDEESATSLLQKQLQDVTQKTYAADKQRDDAKMAAEKAQKELAEAQKDRDAFKSKYETAHANHSQQAQFIRKMETDMAKIRHAVGDLKVKEILGTP